MLEYLNKLKPETWPSPCFVTDLALLKKNAAILDSVQQRTGAKIMLALKCFSQWMTFPVLSRAMRGPLYGCCASSPDEARLAKEDFCGVRYIPQAQFWCYPGRSSLKLRPGKSL